MRRLVHEATSDYHRIFVQDDDLVRTLRFERNPQSSMLLDDPFETDMDYPGRFHIALALKPDAARVLVLGLGGGTVVKRMWRDYPWMRIDAIELDPVVTGIAQEYFALPQDDRIRVFTSEGRGFLERTEERYDLVLIDAFDDDQVPRPLLTDEFLRAARDHMADDGVLAYNFIGRVRGDLSRPFRSLHRTLRNVFANVWVFPIRPEVFITLTEDRNIIVLATDVRARTNELLERIADRVGGVVTVPGFEHFGDDLHHGRIRSGDVPILVDEPRVRRSRRDRRR
jgi:spermidine synthase